MKAENLSIFWSDLKIALRSLARTKGLSITVALTLALGIGANVSIFSVVRGVLLRPLVNRDEGTLIYIRQSAPGLALDNAAFSVPEIDDLRAGTKSLSAFGDFSTIGFTMVGLGDPRIVRAGVVGGSYFEVMGLRPAFGRLLDAHDDGPKAAGAAVLTYRFWTTELRGDRSVIGKTVRLGSRTATIVGILEPCTPYPAETEIIANIVTSPHHLSATMVTGRVHRMTELFGRLAPGATLESARAELKGVYATMVKDHPEAYSKKGDFRIDARMLRDEMTSGSRTILLVLLAASVLVFIIACSNVANLILARSARREGELGIRAALGASPSVLRRTLLAESLLLCGTGAALGVLIARPMFGLVARYAARFSVRALELSFDWTMLWVAVALALGASIFLAYVPRLPSADGQGFALSNSSLRVTRSTNRRLRIFAVTQIGASFVLLAGAAMLLTTLLALQAAQTGFDTRRVLAIEVPVMSFGKTPQQISGFYKEAMRRIDELPGVDRSAFSGFVPWLDGGKFGPGFEFTADGHAPAAGEENPRARFRVVSPGYFEATGIRLIAGRDFTMADQADKEPVVIVSQSLAQRMFPNQDAVNRHMIWTDPIMKFVSIDPKPQRIIGVASDVDDENVTPGPSMSVYHTFEQGPLFSGNLFVHTRTNSPEALIPPIRRIIRDLSSDQPIGKMETLEDIRAEVLSQDRVNTLVFGVFAAVALAIAVVGVAGVLAFAVSSRTREFGIRMAIGEQPMRILTGVVKEGALMAAAGTVAGAAFGWALAMLASSYFESVRMPGAAPLIGSAAVLLLAAVLASFVPAARAARIDAMQALRLE